MQTLLIIVFSLSFQIKQACEVSGVSEIATWDSRASSIVQRLISSESRECHEQLVGLASHRDQSVRSIVSEKIGELKILPSLSIPVLVANFSQPNGEEGVVYYQAVAKYGKQVEKYVIDALSSESWLVRERACDALMLIRGAKNMNQKQLCDL